MMPQYLKNLLFVREKICKEFVNQTLVFLRAAHGKRRRASQIAPDAYSFGFSSTNFTSFSA
jgi:hypothetical protein